METLRWQASTITCQGRIHTTQELIVINNHGIFINRLFFAVANLHAAFSVENEGDNPLDWLKSSIPGEPGTDYPIMAAPQQTSFACDGLVFGGYYADPETECQQYSVCLQVGLYRIFPHMFSFSK